MQAVIRFSGNASKNPAVLARWLNEVNTYLPMATQLMHNGLDFYEAWQRVVQTFKAQYHEDAQIEQSLPQVSTTPQFWLAWDLQLGRWRVATYNQWGQPVWASW
jgi:hypothetical protein